MHHETFEHPLDKSILVLVPAGPFLMGLPEKDLLAEVHEKPQREVDLSAFWIDVHPVTNARYGLFMAAGGYEQESLWSRAGWEWTQRRRIRRPLMWKQAGWDGPDQPVAGVSWYEADAYARWAGRRLPTDAEWEKAARGEDGRRYPWGDEWPTAALANFGQHVGRTTPVGLYADGVSPHGCYDMAGNVNNWTSDWYWSWYGRFCVDIGRCRNPHLDDAERIKIVREVICLDKVDRGGGFATSRECQEVLGCTRKVHVRPYTREPWNGFRTAVEEPVQ